MNTILFVGEHPKTYDVTPHMHEHWELVYCTGGSGTFSFRGDISMAYKEGDLVVIPPNTVHANTSREGFSNIHMNMEDPIFPDRNIMKITDDSDGRIHMAFEQARYYYLADIRKRELVLAAVGDLIAVGNAGAYACTLTAQRFSSHLPPKEFLVDGSGHIMA